MLAVEDDEQGLQQLLDVLAAVVTKLYQVVEESQHLREVVDGVVG